MVKWVKYAMYSPYLGQLLWKRVGADAPPVWTVPLLSYGHGGAERGRLIHALPWGTSPDQMLVAWKETLRASPMGVFRALPDQGQGLIRTLNWTLHRPVSVPLRGTVDGAVMLGDVLTGVEIKTGRYAPSWQKQVARHLTHYPQVLLVVVTPGAALAHTPALVLCSS